MGHGASMKETTLHYYRDPVAEMLSADPEVNFRGVVIVSTSDSFEEKMRSAERVAKTLEALRADGAVFCCNAIGNNHVDFARAIERTEECGIATAALALCPGSDFVVQNKYLSSSVICCYKTEDAAEVGDETNVLAENTITALDGRKGIALLKLKLRARRRGQ